MNIGLGFDGIIVDSDALKRLAARRLFGINVNSASMKRELVAGKLLNDRDYDQLVEFTYSNLDFGMEMQPVEGMSVYIRSLMGAGHNLSIITSRGPAEVLFVKAWLLRRRLILPITRVGNGVLKATAAEAEKIDIFIDDDLDKLEPLIGHVPHLCLMHWPYNADAEPPEPIQRVSSWASFHRFVESIAPLGAR